MRAEDTVRAVTYLFGDTELAARRLTVLARVFEPPTRDFLGAWRSGLGGLDPQLVAPTVLDLGCGPGHTTRLLATLLDRHVIGLDSSDAFLYEARRLRPSRVSFQLHDVTDVAFPTPAAHLMYARFLLTHLEDVAAVLASWRANLRPGGWLLLEEPEWISTTVEPFRVYLDWVAASLRRCGTELYVGARLAEQAAASGGFSVRLDRVVEHDVADRDAATMFAWNLPSVRSAPEVAESHSATELDALQRELDDLAYGLGQGSRIRWGLRQLALRME
jgi:SAM-dependent methyltransferase